MKLTQHIAALLLAATAFSAHADAITDWNIKSGEIIAEAKIGTPPAVRIMAIVQTAALDAVTEAAQRDRSSNSAAIDAAVAAAHRATLLKLLPAQQATIEAAYQAALAPITDNAAKSAGIAIGEKCAATLLAQRSDDGAAGPETYRPHTTAGAYVPTAAAAVPQWAQRKPWLLSNPAQLRPAAPPALNSAAWAREYNEVKDLGARNSARRSSEHTEIARFWEYSLPAIYHGVVRSVALQPGRDVARNARLFAAAAQAMDDALISVWDAKYHYNFWRPMTAIRNGDIDGNDATQREPSWMPLLEAPMHPEYPSGHSILAAAVGAILKADIAGGPVPVLATSSPTAKGATRRWSSVDDFVQEVSDARIYAGIHYRAATEAGVAMGKQVGELAVNKLLRPAPKASSTSAGQGG
jgi:PAP2 superfamily